MSTLFLRDLLYSGFCGKHRIVAANNGLGRVHAMLDRIIAAGALSTLGEESNRVQLANQFQIPYIHKPHFDQCLQGIYERREEFTGHEDRAVEERIGEVPKYPDLKIRFTTILDKSMILTEPVYSFYVPQHHMPLYAILSTILSGWGVNNVKVKMVSVCSEGPDFTNFGHYHIVEEMKKLLDDALDSEKLKVGVGCTTCPVTDCKFQDPFEQLMLEWLKSQKTEEALKEKVRQHLIWHGPTKVGAHLVYMKETVRRTLPSSNLAAFLQMIQQHDPKGHTKYLNSSTAVVFKAVEKGELPKEIIGLFKQTPYHTIETGLSL